MSKSNFITKVEEFHKAFNHPILSTPQIPSKERCELRINLLTEELKELIEGVKNKDIVEIADAFADIQYVLCGAILEFGLGEKFQEIFDEVQRSNMSKVCSTFEEAEQTLVKSQNEGVSCYIKAKEDKFIVFRESDNKIIKSINYSAANIREIIEK